MCSIKGGDTLLRGGGINYLYKSLWICVICFTTSYIAFRQLYLPIGKLRLNFVLQSTIPQSLCDSPFYTKDPFTQKNAEKIRVFNFTNLLPAFKWNEIIVMGNVFRRYFNSWSFLCGWVKIFGGNNVI